MLATLSFKHTIFSVVLFTLMFVAVARSYGIANRVDAKSNNLVVEFSLR